MTGNHYSVGERVRVRSVKDGTSQRAIIAYCNADESLDVIYDAKSDSRSDQSDEEFSVLPSRVASLILFELSDHTIKLPLEMKDYGNALFKLMDYDAAIQYYKAGVASILSSRKISTGSSVLVQVKSASGEEFHSAIIADEDDGFFEIIFDDDSLGEEAGISPTRLTPLAADNAENHCEKHEASATEDSLDKWEKKADEKGIESDLSLQRALYLNLARCYLKRIPALNGWSARMASMAIGISRRMVRQHCPTCQISRECSSSSSAGSWTKSTSGEYMYDIDGGRKESTSSVLTSDVWMQRATLAVMSLLHAIFLLARSFFFPSGNRIFPDKQPAIPEIAMNSRDPLAEKSGDELLLLKQLADGYYIRAKSFLAACRPYLARKDASHLLCYDKKRTQEIEAEVEAFLKKRSKSNRKLARDVAEWVDIAVSSSCRKSEKLEGGRGGGHVTGDVSSVPTGDIEIDDDDTDGSWHR